MNIYAQLLKRRKREHGMAFDALVEHAREELHGAESLLLSGEASPTPAAWTSC